MAQTCSPLSNMGPQQVDKPVTILWGHQPGI